MLTSTGEYAVRAVIRVAQQPPEVFILAREIGTELSIPEHYLANILGALTRKGLLAAQRGRGGGFRLNLPATEITVMDVLEAIGRGEIFERCILGHKKCCDDEPCVMHFSWKERKEGLVELFSKTRIADLV